MITKKNSSYAYKSNGTGAGYRALETVRRKHNWKRFHICSFSSFDSSQKKCREKQKDQDTIEVKSHYVGVQAE